MAIQLKKEADDKRHIISLEDYERMIDAGLITEDERIELIRGEIVTMAALGLSHEACVRRLTKLLERAIGDRVIVSVQNSIRLPKQVSQPEPDVALLRWRDDFYEGSRVLPEDVLLVVEVADSSLRYDRKVRAVLYAEADIPEMWIVNIRGSVIEVYSDPFEGAYRKQLRVKPGEVVPLPGSLEGALSVSVVLGIEVISRGS